MASRAYVDFTIIIPEFVRLSTAPYFNANESKADLISVSKTSSDRSLSVVSNGGTISMTQLSSGADSRLSPTASTLGDQGTAPKAYLVAMP